MTLKCPLRCPVGSQSASEGRNTAALGDRIPRAHSDQGGGEGPTSVLDRTPGPECAAGCVTVGNSHRTPGLGDSFIRPWILHCLSENKLETSSKYNLSHNIKETNPFMLMP